jgi:hypothetical protein
MNQESLYVTDLKIDSHLPTARAIQLMMYRAKSQFVLGTKLFPQILSTNYRETENTEQTY